MRSFAVAALAAGAMAAPPALYPTGPAPVATVYECAPEVVDCPYRKTATIATIPLSTGPARDVVKTVYACPPEVVECPYRSATVVTKTGDFPARETGKIVTINTDVPAKPTDKVVIVKTDVPGKPTGPAVTVVTVDSALPPKPTGPAGPGKDGDKDVHGDRDGDREGDRCPDVKTVTVTVPVPAGPTGPAGPGKDGERDGDKDVHGDRDGDRTGDRDGDNVKTIVITETVTAPVPTGPAGPKTDGVKVDVPVYPTGPAKQPQAGPSATGGAKAPSPSSPVVYKGAAASVSASGLLGLGAIVAFFL